MRAYLKYANLIALGAGLVGALLSGWMFSAGTDERGLYPASHPAWILLGILSVAVAAAFWLLARQGGVNRNYRQNFPPSLPAALGCLAGAVGLLSGGWDAMGTGNALCLLTGAVGIAGGLCLLWAAVCRFRGLRARLPMHCLPCFFFALQLFVLGQEFGSEPEMQRYLYRFWAIAALVPAGYCLWGFDVKLGKRPHCLFWCLAAGYCNLVAAVGSGQMLLHLGMAAWMLLALPKLTYLPKPKPAPEPAPEAPTVEETPADSLAVDLPDTDAILAELLRDLEQKESEL